MKNYELQAFLQFDDSGTGNAAANQSFNVTIARNGSGDATIYSDANGTTEITRPFTTDSYGRFKFYAPNGYYNILFDDPDVANLNNLLDRDIFAVEAATTEQSGLVELATQAEMDAGASDVVPTADVVKTYVDSQSGGGESNTSSNAGAGEGLALPKSGVDLPFKSLTSSGSVSLTPSADSIDISSNAEVNQAQSLGSGEAVYSYKTGETLSFKSLVADGNVSFSSTPTELTISAQTPDSVVLNDAIVNNQSASYTLTVSDRGKTVDVDSASANVITVPTNATQSIPINSVVIITQIGAGQTTITGDTGVSINGVSAGSVSITDQWKSAVLRKLSADAWHVEGSIQ